ncbi:MAG TPA: hypothetical protein QGG47_13440 [Acidobacteriota bacterium]|jgi:hypothetical protein|nr:hypothetical protein [Acidobacteriota bacterium]
MSNSMQIRQSALITAVLLLRAVPASPEPRLEPEPTGLVPKATQQQQQRPCSTPEHRQFDFWIGDWEVFNPQGQRVGSNRIDKVLGGCALHESWRGSTGHRGSSYNFYDTTSGKWHQTWIDVAGAPLYINGGFAEGRMRMVDEAGTSRITWTPLESGHVRQHWEQSADDGGTWTTVFDGEYRRVY